MPRPETSVAVITWEKEERWCYWHLAIKTRDTIVHLTLHRTAPLTTENNLINASIVSRLKNSTPV